MQKHYVDCNMCFFRPSSQQTILHLDGNTVVRVSCCMGGNIAALLVGSLGNSMVPASENQVITQKRWMR